MKKRKRNNIVFVLLVLLSLACLASTNKANAFIGDKVDSAAVTCVPEAKPFYVKRGVASWYGKHFNGRRTASGERFNKEDMTCAHRWLPFGSLVRVTNTNNGESVIVRVNDRGPYVGKRIIDLSDAAAREIGIIGCATVVIEAFDDSLSDELYAETKTEDAGAQMENVKAQTENIEDQTENVEDQTGTDSVQECPAILRENTSSAAYVDLAAIAQLMQTNDRPQARSVIVDYHNHRVNVHGYTVLAAVVHDYRTALRIRDELLARGFRTVHLRVSVVANEAHFEVCVGLEPVAIACEMTEDQLVADYPTATITYIESKHDDTYQTTACAD